MNVRIVRLMGYFGILSPIIGALMIALSIQSSPWFNWSDYALSHLGARGFGSVLFNGGLPMTGAVLMMFSSGLFVYTHGSLIGQIGSSLHLAIAFTLVALGPVNINVQPWHNYLSVSLFVFIPISLLLLSIYNFRNDMKPYAYIGFLSSVVAAAIWGYNGISVALQEVVAALAMTVWQIPLAAWMIRLEPPDDDEFS